MSKILMISADCHAGALPGTYVEYLPEQYREDGRRWWINFAREMMNRAGTFFDQEAVEVLRSRVGDDQVAGLDAFALEDLDQGEAGDPRRVVAEGDGDLLGFQALGEGFGAARSLSETQDLEQVRARVILVDPLREGVETPSR